MMRLILSFLPAGLIVLSIFWVLQSMIQISATPVILEENLRTIDFIRLQKEQILPPKKRIKPKPKKKPPKPKVKELKKRVIVKRKLVQKKLQPKQITLKPKVPVRQQWIETQPIKLQQLPKTATEFDQAVAVGDDSMLSEELGFSAPTELVALSALSDAVVASPPPPPIQKPSNLMKQRPVKQSIDTNVVPLVRVNPIYPKRAKMMKKEGYVKLEFLINTAGRVKDISIVESHPQGLFDVAARRALLKWKFNPKIENEQAVEQKAVVQIDFKLKR